MARFDFIVGKQFQDMLESDYAELHASREAKAWKSVQVLAGSIIEAILIDYLVSTTNPKRPKKDPLTVALAEAIEICKAEGAISERTSNLCSVVRSYRNLIHPGRSVRLIEKAPNEDSSAIAIAVVNEIIGDVARVRQTQLGLTADQLLSKIERDPNSLNILRHLLQDMREPEIERFMLEVLPQRYTRDPDGEDNEFFSALRKAYQMAHDVAPEAIRQQAILQYIKVLREEDGSIVAAYDFAFFNAEDLVFANESQVNMVKTHLLAKLKPVAMSHVIRQFSGVERYLVRGDVAAFVDPILRAFTTPRQNEDSQNAIETHFSRAMTLVSPDVRTAIAARLHEWRKRYADNSDSAAPSVIGRLQDAVLWSTMPELPEEE